MKHTQRILTLAVTAAVSQIAAAQSPTDSSKTLSPVVVRETAIAPLVKAGNLATGTNASTMDTPFSASSLPVDVLRAQGGTTLQDALRNMWAPARTCRVLAGFKMLRDSERHWREGGAGDAGACRLQSSA